MKDDTKSPDIAPNSNSNAKGKKGKHSEPPAIGAIVLFFLLAFLAMLGWSMIELTPVRVVLYTLGSFSIGLGAFALIDELTHKAYSNYSLVLMSFILFALFMNGSRLTDITALRWLSIAFAILFGFGALITLIVQLNKDIREKPTLKWVIAVPLILGLPVLFAWLFQRPIILSLVPFGLIVLYNEYLMTTYLTKPAEEPQINPDVSHKGSTVVATFLSLPRTLRSIRRPVYPTLIFFSAVFYFTLTQQASQTYDSSIFYQAVAPAYFGILAIVIAFAVLVIRPDKGQRTTEHLRLPITGLVQMYVVFALVNVFGLLIGTGPIGHILTATTNFNDIIGSADNMLHILQLLVLQFAVSAFPVGLLYLYAMIRDFMTPQVGGSNHP